MNGESGQSFDPIFLSAELISCTIATGLMYWISKSGYEKLNIWLIVAIILALALSLIGCYIDNIYECKGCSKIIVTAMKVLYIPTFSAVILGVLKIELDILSVVLIAVMFNLVADFIRKCLSGFRST